jgi:putative copper resistance protein D
MVAILSAATNWLLFVGLVMGVGSLVARWIFVPRAAGASPEVREHLLASAGRLGFAAGVVLPIAVALVFLRQLLEFRDPFAPWSEDVALLLTATPWGATWGLAAGLSLVALVGYALTRIRPLGAWSLTTPAVLGLATYPALSGHASGTEGLRGLTIPADILHVLAAGAWIGGLAFVMLAERGWRTSVADRHGSLLPTLVPIFSPIAIASVGTLLVTGVVASWVQLGSVGDLVGTAYGRLLTLKVGVVAMVLYLGAVNWRRLTPHLGAEAGQAALRRNATRELMVAQVVLVITAVLVRTAPMGH